MLIAQISDLHVRPAGQLYGGAADANAHLTGAIRHLHALDRLPDLVILSGDLVEHGAPEEYAQAASRLKDLTLPFLIVAGNHDDRDCLRQAFPDHRYLPETGALNYCIDEHPVRILVLDTCRPGLHHGEVDEQDLAWLDRTLRLDPTKATLLVMHHPPFVSGIPYLDKYRLMRPEPVAEILRGFSNIEAILCGHVHRTMIKRWAGTVVVSCPSTTTEIALQWRPDAVPQTFLGPPACMLHAWDPLEGLVSHLSHIDKGAGPFPFF